MSREPSMEEILSSIRRVIARDEAARDGALDERFGSVPSNAAGGDHPDEPEDDVLDLTEMETPVIAETPVTTEAAPAAPLVSADSEVAARQAIGQLTAALENGAEPAMTMMVATPGVTVEALAEAALRPMLKAWLDANLPPLVERLVAREIARITGGRI